MESQRSWEGVTFSVAEGWENSLAMLESSLLRLVLASMRFARAFFCSFFCLLQELVEVVEGCSLLECHFLSTCLQLHFAVFSSGVFQLACLVDLLCLLVLIGATKLPLSMIQAVNFFKACSRLGAGLG